MTEISEYIDELKEAKISEKDVSIIVQKLNTLSMITKSEMLKIVGSLKTNAEFRTQFMKDPKVLAKIQADGKLGRTPYVW